MKNNWEEEGLKFLEKFFGEKLSIDETNSEIKAILQPIMNFLGISSKLGEGMARGAYLDMSFESFFKAIDKFFEENPAITEEIGKIGQDILKVIQSVEFHKTLLSIPSESEFENSIKSRFLEELEQTEGLNKKLIIESFKLALKEAERYEEPDQLFILSSYSKLGIQSNEFKTDTVLNSLLSIMQIIVDKRKNLFLLSDIELKDYLSEFVSRFGRAIEPYLRIIIVSIYNLQKIKSHRFNKFDDFKQALGHYLNLVNIKRSKDGNYFDFRNAIQHQSFDVSFNRKTEEIFLTFHLKRERKGRIYWEKKIHMDLSEFEIIFRDFRKFQNLFFYFYEIYIKSSDKNYKFKYWPM